jgi:hypothetical protein
MIQARLLPLARVKRPAAPTPFVANRVHCSSCRDCSIKSLEVDPGHTLARLVRAPDSHSSDRGEGEGDRRCRLASSLTDRGRGYPTEIRIRSGARQVNATSTIAAWTVERQLRRTSTVRVGSPFPCGRPVYHGGDPDCRDLPHCIRSDRTLERWIERWHLDTRAVTTCAGIRRPTGRSTPEARTLPPNARFFRLL